MTRWPTCPLCQEPTSYLDEWGICQRVSITHQAIRHPEEFPPLTSTRSCGSC